MKESQAPAEDVTVLLRAWRDGDDAALERMAPKVYSELRRRAGRLLVGERSHHSLQPTELVNEVFLRLINVDVSWQDRAHFLAVAARAMRRILVDHARSRGRVKRGSGEPMVPMDDLRLSAPGPESGPEELLALDRALADLGQLDPTKVRMVEMSFFGGLTVREIAEVLGGSRSAVHRDLQFAKSWLYRRLAP